MIDSLELMPSEVSQPQHDMEPVESPRMRCVFGNHDFRNLEPSLVHEQDRFLAFIDSPYSSWSPEVIQSVLNVKNNGVLCVDGIGLPTSQILSDQGIYDKYLRTLIVVATPLLGEKNEVDFILADPLFSETLSPIIGTQHVDLIEQRYNKKMFSEVLANNSKDYGEQVIATFLLYLSIHTVVTQLKKKNLQQVRSSSMSRRKFLKTMGVLGLGAAISSGVAQNVAKYGLLNEGFTLDTDTDSLSYSLTKVLNPHFNPRIFVDGRTALLYSSCLAHSEEVGKNGLVLLGNEHIHFSEKIMENRSYRVEKIRDLYVAYIELIRTINNELKGNLSEQEIVDVARSLMTNIGVAHIRKPSLEEGVSCFERPQDFVQISNQILVPEIQEALQA